MTDQEYWEHERKMFEPLTPEQLAVYYRGMMQATPEQMAVWSLRLQNDPYEVKWMEIQERAKRDKERRFTRWCRGARKWEQ
jgi:hypothetical protein